MDKQKVSYFITSAVVAVALIVYAAYILVGIYPDMLITAQDRNVFSDNSLFFSEMMVQPFGIFKYAGSFLTQFFFYPAVGAGMLIALWAAIVVAGIKAFRLKGAWQALMIIPAMCLLTSIVDMGYWIYILNIQGYWFSQSVAFLCCLLLLWATRFTPRRFRLAWYIAVGVVMWPLFGWTSYLFAVCLLLMQFGVDGEKRCLPSWIDALGVVLTFLSPLVYHALLFENIPTDITFAGGFPIFKTSTDTSMRPTLPFFILTGVTLVAALSGVVAKRSESKPAGKLRAAWPSVATIVVAVVSAYSVWTYMFKDMNYLYEMHMTQATMNDDWKEVIATAEKTSTPSRTMVMLKNIALMNTGELGNRSFDLSNDGIEIYNPEKLNLNIMQIASPAVYYNFGNMNYAMRWCMEFAVPYGFSPFYLRHLARCSSATGEKQLSERYIDRLHSMLFYKDWQPKAASKKVKLLQMAFNDVLSSDDNSCEHYILRTFSGARCPGNLFITELSLFYSLITRETAKFWSAFYDYLLITKGKNLPGVYEEAYCTFMNSAPENLPFSLKVDSGILQNYKNFMDTGNRYAEMGYTKEGVANAMREEFGKTYWWFNAFGRDKY